jgi:hypothetical protein
MVEDLTLLFKIWESLKDSNLSIDNRQKLTDDWDNLCLQVQVQLYLNPTDKQSYLNAIAALSDRIYAIYRKHKKLSYLRKLLEDLELLLAERELPTKFKTGLYKWVISTEGKLILITLKSLLLPNELILLMQFAFKDINVNFQASKKLVDYVHRFSFWMANQKTLTLNEFVEHLIEINFNHPLILHYLIHYFKLSSEHTDDTAKLFSIHKLIEERQIRLEFMNFQSSDTLFVDRDSLFVRLQRSMKFESDFIHLQLGRLINLSNIPDVLDLQNNAIKGNNTLKKAIGKWPSEKSDLVELAYAMYIYMRSRGSQVTIAKLVKWFEEAFGVSLSRYSHRFAEIKMRKATRPSKFLDTMVNEFLGYVEEGDAFQPGQ